MIKFIIVVLLIIITISQLCHSSCKSCQATNTSYCLACPSGVLNPAVSTTLMQYCTDIPLTTTILEEIDTNWIGGTPYLTGIYIDAGIYTPTTPLGYTSPPLTIGTTTPGTTFIGLLLTNIPANHYKIHVRTHGKFDRILYPLCLWYQFDLNVGSVSSYQNVTTKTLSVSEWQNVAQFNDTSTTLEIKYISLLSDSCLSMTIIDVTIVSFVCSTNCTTCSNYSVCTSCGIISGTLYYLDDLFTCVSTCLNSYYSDINNNQYLCDFCDISCSVCEGNSINCTSCNILGGYVLAYNNNTCLTSCPDGQYIDVMLNQCELCNSNCLTCANSPSNCMSCTNTTAGEMYLNNFVCIYSCPKETYANITSNQCVPCDISCASCTGPTNLMCQSCNNNTITGVTTIYYLQIGQTICSTKCPTGQFANPSIPNLCQPCTSNCVTCQTTSTKCLSCPSGYYLYNSTCIYTCVAGTYASNTTNTCAPCNNNCLTCTTLATTCLSCGNTSTIVSGVTKTTIYYLNSSYPVCNLTCKKGFVGISSINTCVQCQTGCTTCQFNSSFCQMCQLVGTVKYYLYSNSCVLYCPDGTYQNDIDLTCLTCAYYTLNQQCVQSCPSGYSPTSKSNVLVCVACTTSCASQQSQQNKPFTIQTKVSSANTFEHSVKFPSGLSQTCTTQSIAKGLQVNLYKNSRRLLITATAFTIISISISADYSTITIVTNSMQIDISTASVGITFSAGSIVSSSGAIYNSLSSYIALQNPTFISSYYQVYIQNKNNQVEGIFFIILSTVLLISSLFVQKEQTTNSVINFVQTIQIVGLIRIRSFKIVLDWYNVLIGFSYFQLTFIPNPIMSIGSLTTNQIGSDSSVMTYGSQNFISNFGSIIFIVAFMEVVAFTVQILYQSNQGKLKLLRTISKTIIQFWIVIILYGSILSLLSLVSNTLMGTNALFVASILLSIIIVLSIIVYLFSEFKTILLTKFFSISNFFKIISLIALSYRYDVGVVCFNSFQVLLIILQIIFYRSERTNLLTYFGQKVLILTIINCCLFITVPSVLLPIIGSFFALLACLNIYKLMKSILEYFQQKTIPVEIDDKPLKEHLQISIKSQSKLQFRRQNNVFSHSQNFIYDQTPQKMCESTLVKLPQTLKETSVSHNKHNIQIQNFDDSKLQEDPIQTQVKAVRRKLRVKQPIKQPEQQVAEIVIINIDQVQKRNEQQIARQAQERPQAELHRENFDELQIVSID